MSIRCKMLVASKSDQFNTYDKSKSTVVRLQPVSGDENKTWSKWTPSGSIELNINNPEAVDRFKLGGTYFVDFTEAPATEAEEKK